MKVSGGVKSNNLEIVTFYTTRGTQENCFKLWTNHAAAFMEKEEPTSYQQVGQGDSTFASQGW